MADSDPENDILFVMAARDPDHVSRVLADIVERLKAEGRHSESEAAAVQLYRELGIRCCPN